MKRVARDREMAQLLALVDEAFDHKAWHGTTLKGSIRGLSAADVAWRPGPKRHNIWEIVVHAAYWKYAVRRRVTDQKRGSFALAGSNWFGCPASATEQAWQEAVSLLVDEHRQLREVIARLRRSDLPKAPRRGQVTNATLIRGIAAHDLYHAGQIQLLKRLRR